MEMNPTDHQDFTNLKISALHCHWDRLKKSTHRNREVLTLQIPSLKRKTEVNNTRSMHTVRDLAETYWQGQRFFVHVIAMKLLLQNRLRNQVASIRELYYQDVSSFRKDHRVCFEAIENISMINGCLLSKDYMVFPSSKGLLYGGPHICFYNGSNLRLSLNYSEEPRLIPNPSEQLSITIQPKAIVLFEKDSVLKSYCDHFSRHSLITKDTYLFVTAKGYPDRSSLKFLKEVVKQCPLSYIIAFMDSDVYGINIHLSYERGLGDIGRRLTYGGALLLEYKNGLLTISKRDVTFTIALIRRIFAEQNDYPVPYSKVHHLLVRELRRGLVLLKKAEINTIGTTETSDKGLFTYIDEKINLLAPPV